MVNQHFKMTTFPFKETNTNPSGRYFLDCNTDYKIKFISMNVEELINYILVQLNLWSPNIFFCWHTLEHWTIFYYGMLIYILVFK